MADKKRVLIYKRTHCGDPDGKGVFGINGCMGRVRSRNFDAVIGIGGIRIEGIARRINWIGIGARKIECYQEDKYPMVTFDKFVLFEEKGLLLNEIAPGLYYHLFEDERSRFRRVLMSTSLQPELVDEVNKILDLAEKAPPSKGL